MHTRIEVIGLMGEVEIIVPKAFRITDDIITFMGSASLKQSRQRVPLDDDAPTITITGAAILSDGVVRKLWTCCVVFLGVGGGGFCLWWVLGELVFLRLLVGSSRFWCVVVDGYRRLQSMWPRLYVLGLW